MTNPSFWYILSSFCHVRTTCDNFFNRILNLQVTVILKMNLEKIWGVNVLWKLFWYNPVFVACRLSITSVWKLPIFKVLSVSEYHMRRKKNRIQSACLKKAFGKFDMNPIIHRRQVLKPLQMLRVLLIISHYS